MYKRVKTGEQNTKFDFSIIEPRQLIFYDASSLSKGELVDDVYCIGDMDSEDHFYKIISNGIFLYNKNSMSECIEALKNIFDVIVLM